MAAPHSTLLSEKGALRRHMRALRATLDRTRAAAAIAEQVLHHLPLAPGTAIAGVWPLPEEIDLRPLWHALHQSGHPIFLPQTPPKGHPLIFRAWHPAAAMIPERYGTQHPDGPVGIPALIFVPLLAFDAAGHRLGYGGGYYDRTLAAHPGARSVGFGFAAQQVPRVPAGEHDQKLAAIVTEHGPVALGAALPPGFPFE